MQEANQSGADPRHPAALLSAGERWWLAIAGCTVQLEHTFRLKQPLDEGNTI